MYDPVISSVDMLSLVGSGMPHGRLAIGHAQPASAVANTNVTTTDTMRCVPETKRTVSSG